MKKSKMQNMTTSKHAKDEKAHNLKKNVSTNVKTESEQIKKGSAGVYTSF